MEKKEPESRQKEFIDPVTTPFLFWIIKSIGSAILGWITWNVLDLFRKKKVKTGVDRDAEKQVS
jgi:threonine/homoserine/homoserine lactone efflux protein